jgi:D-alanine-D-alanine ligase
MKRLSVAVVQGGPSAEAEVSRASAKGVAQALVEAGHQVVRFELDAFLAESIRQGGYDVVFPAVHGAVGEDGSLQGLLEVLEVPYVGSGVLASALAMDKRQARVAFAAAGLPIAPCAIAFRGEESAADAARRARRDVGARVVVKPAVGGSAIGVARFEAEAPDHEVALAIEAAWALSDVALVEHFARGREVTCGILDAGELVAFPPTEIASPRDAFYTYEAKYAPGRSVHTCPALIGDELTHRVQRAAREAHRALGCRDLSRVDFIVGDDGAPDALTQVTLLEVNTLPGFTTTSLYPEAAAVSGIPMRDLVDRLVRHARARGTTRRSPPRPLPR